MGGYSNHSIPEKEKIARDTSAYSEDFSYSPKKNDFVDISALDDLPDVKDNVDESFWDDAISNDNSMDKGSSSDDDFWDAWNK